VALSALDGLIVAGYLAATLVIALMLRRRAAQSIDSYYLGNKKMPWYLLCLSDASGMFDISGTMWLATLLFVYGLKSIWLPWLWPVFNQVFLMAYLAIWLRRSNVRSGAEWILFRFGENQGSRLSHLSVVLFAVICVVGFLVYAFAGIGKFVELFIPWEAVGPTLGLHLDPAFVPQFYAIVFTSLVTLYVVLGGMPGIVWTDVLQFTIMAAAAVFIAILALNLVAPDQLSNAPPPGWMSPSFGWHLGLDWSGISPAVQAKVRSDGYELFGPLFMMMIFSGILKSAAGPAPSYDMQRILATRRPQDAAKLTGFVSIVLMPIRYLMITGFTVLSLAYINRLDLVSGASIDLESVLPAAIRAFAPDGVRGLIITGLLAAFIGTFSASLNAAPLYIVNDIYRRYINPAASQRTLVSLSYAVSILIVLISMGIGLFVSSINAALQWIVSGLWGGYTVSNVLKWYWWRFNGYGFFWGMIAGIACSLSFPFIFGPFLPELGAILPLYLFPLIILVSGLAAVVASLRTPATEMQVLKTFYRQVRPWGFWKPVQRALELDGSAVPPNREFKRDAFNILVGAIVQVALVAVPIFLVVQNFADMGLALLVCLVGALILWKSWYQRLRDWPAGAVVPDSETARCGRSGQPIVHQSIAAGTA
jgi:Na+/proline symporter